MSPIVLTQIEPDVIEVHGRSDGKFHGEVVRNRDGWIIRTPNGRQQARLVVPPTGSKIDFTMDELIQLSPLKGKHLIHKIVRGYGRGKILHFRTSLDAAEFAYLNY